jgi:GNAT superfamily N-acetyltransferase
MALEHELRPPVGDAEWAVYHDIRRHVLFERRGRGADYDAAHPDERRAGHHPLVLWLGGEAVGVIRVDVDGPVARFRRVAIREDVQRRGLGRLLLAHAEQFARAHGCARVESHVDADAVGFYERCGFVHEGAPKGTAGRPVLMTKSLSCPPDGRAVSSPR